MVASRVQQPSEEVGVPNLLPDNPEHFEDIEFLGKILEPLQVFVLQQLLQ